MHMTGSQKSCRSWPLTSESLPDEISDFHFFEIHKIQPGSGPRQMQQQEYGDDGPFGGLPTVADHIAKEVPKNDEKRVGQKSCKKAGARALQVLRVQPT